METHDLSVAEAVERVLALVPVLLAETVPLLDSLGRVLADDVVANNSLPPFTNSAMDGYAVIAADTQISPAKLNVIGDIAAGHVPTLMLTSGTAARIMTGAMLPDGADAVIPVEDTDEDWRSAERTLPETVTVYRTVGAGDYVRPAGDDVVAGDVIVRKGHLVRPQEISVLASLGVANMPVVRRPLVGILATGDELVEPDRPLGAGQIRNSNGYAQAAQVIQMGGIPLQLGIGRDTEADVREKLQAGLDAGVDLFVSSAGVSVGAFDVVKTVLDADGDVDFWRVKMRPGKPLAFGTYQGVPYLGLPGNPVSSMVSFFRFGRPAIRKMMGFDSAGYRTVTVTLLDEMKSDGRETYARMIVEEGDLGWTARTTGKQGSHIITSLVDANALVVMPEGVKVVAAGEKLTAYLL